jgi:two-component system, chemotaxis family, protein-glutamate methylesterase/glutaminase
MPQRDLIVIGGSTGAAVPLRTILGGLPEDLPASVVVVIHVAAGGTGFHAFAKSAVKGLLVHRAEDGMPLALGAVYLAQPGRHLLIEDGKLRLGHGPRENLSRPAIDPLFRSAAISHGPRAIGVILSGLMNDGAAGLAALKRCGGAALVHAPKDAEAPEMPLSALEATQVDLSAAAVDLAPAILRCLSEPVSAPGDSPADIRMEVEIAAGVPLGSDRLAEYADPVALTCPDCGGVLSQLKDGHPLRFRCQVGHAFTDRALFERQESEVDEAMRVALRIVEERAELVGRMGRDATRAGRRSLARMYEERAEEYRGHAGTLREAVMRSMESPMMLSEDDVLEAQVRGAMGSDEVA